MGSFTFARTRTPTRGSSRRLLPPPWTAGRTISSRRGCVWSLVNDRHGKIGCFYHFLEVRGIMEAHRMNPDSEDGQERPVVNNRPQRAYRGRLSAMFMELDRLLLASRTVYSRNKNKFKKRSRNMILREVTDLLNKIWIDDQVFSTLVKMHLFHPLILVLVWRRWRRFSEGLQFQDQGQRRFASRLKSQQQSQVARARYKATMEIPVICQDQTATRINSASG